MAQASEPEEDIIMGDEETLWGDEDTTFDD